MARRTSHGKSKLLNVTGPQIRALRERRALSQADLARRLQLAGWDIDFATLNRIETQKRTITDVELLMIARVLKVGLDAFE